MGKVMSLVQSPDPMGESQNWQHTLAISAQGRQRWVDPWVPQSVWKFQADDRFSQKNVYQLLGKSI